MPSRFLRCTHCSRVFTRREMSFKAASFSCCEQSDLQPWDEPLMTTEARDRACHLLWETVLTLQRLQREATDADDIEFAYELGSLVIRMLAVIAKNRAP